MFRLRVRVSLAVLYILFLKRRWFLCLLTLKLKIIFIGSRSSEVEYLVEAQGGESSKLSESIMECWLNWYSSRLEICHSERILGFKSLTLRYIKNNFIYYAVLAELVLHQIANLRSSFIRCVGSSPTHCAVLVA